MNTPTATFIEVEPNAAVLLQRLQQQAAAQGLSLEALLRPLAEPASSASGNLGEAASLEPVIDALHPNQGWLQANRSAYRDQWVVLYQGELIAHGTDGAAVVETARAQGIPEPFIAFIPAEDLPFAGF